VPARLTTAIECGGNTRHGTVPDTTQTTMSRHAFDILAGIIDDPTTAVDSLGPFLSVDVEQTGQTWVYPIDIFLANLARRAGDQTRARACLARFTPAEPSDKA
jgi:hypothetical protein